MKIKVNDSMVDFVADNRIQVWAKNLFVKFIIWLKNTNRFTRGMIVITGQVKDELYDPKTGKTIKTVYPVHFAHYNAIANAYKYALAKWTGASNSSEYIGANGLMTQASFDGKDGILEYAADYAFTTTKDSGGTGSEAYIVFKGVRTAAGSESYTTLGLGLTYLVGELTTPYATQAISKSLTSGQVYTVYWTITIS